ncbi:DNA methylase [Sandarakinorhabdus cyanobacteriorum]|uniref:Methyltransferase n=1 Tax=Sandarakinorhabdus cyanobacteriorum TaxID=1981098 RepID=A0A255YS20_9SPHN|nr:site-specific DNA-methyltransferase [Sandarakinorhabdus cyanobacteriorum]OYQ31250.1 DNA methylase [Sandarakinorhabdus cyanobacteriorum]
MDQNWPAQSSELLPIEKITPYARNSRTHSDEQVAQIAASIREWGWTNPILVDEDGGLLAGHGRLAAARKLGLTQIPTMVAKGWSEAQKKAYVIADNKLALNAGWDLELLAVELGDLQGFDFDLMLTGFSDEELSKLLAEKTEGNTDPDEIPEAPIDPIAKPGDVWLLGKHRLVCGDSTDADTVAKALNGVSPHLMVTDPPYGVEYDPAWREKAGVGASGTAKGKVLNDDKADWREAWALFPGDVAYVWHAGLYAGVVGDSLAACDLMLRSQIIWDKGQLVLSRGDYHWEHEPCWYAVKKGAKGHWAGDRKQTTVWHIAKPKKNETGHGTQKPVECMKRPIENNSSPGQAVYEPFSGSGTTIIAGEMTGRVVHAIELNPAYIDVAVKRWQDFTGKAATLEGDGRTFDEIAGGRIAEAA